MQNMQGVSMTQKQLTTNRLWRNKSERIRIQFHQQTPSLSGCTIKLSYIFTAFNPEQVIGNEKIGE